MVGDQTRPGREGEVVSVGVVVARVVLVAVEFSFEEAL